MLSNYHQRRAASLDFATLVLLTASSIAGCTFTRTVTASVVVEKGTSVEEKRQIAATVVNEPVLALIRNEIKKREPSTNDGDLHRIALRVRENYAVDRSGKPFPATVDILISVENPSRESGQRVLTICAELIQEALHGRAEWLKGS
jgi:hypothetical protein